MNNPVKLPPGRSRLATSPERTGSVSRSIATIGTVLVRCAALTAAGPTTMSTPIS
jgi:hypothetical protein